MSFAPNRQKITLPAASTADTSDILVPLVLTGNALLKGRATEGGSNVYFTDSSGAEIPHATISCSHAVLWDAAVSWYSIPEAIQSSSGYVYVGGCGSDGIVRVVKIDPSNRTIVQAIDVFDVDDPDDHNNPLFVELPNGAIRIFFCQHDGPKCWTSVTAADGSLDALPGNVVEITSALVSGGNVDYPKPVLTDDGTLWLFYRDGNSSAGPTKYVTSADGGSTWSSPRVLIQYDGHAPYVVVTKNRANGNRIDIGMSDMHPNQGQSSMFHGYLLANTAKVYQSDGTEIGDADAGPYLPSAFAQVVSGPGDGGRSYWIAGIGTSVSGTPYIISSNASDNWNCVYGWFRWTGSAWTSRKLAINAGEIVPNNWQYQTNPYQLGVELDWSDPNKVLLIKRSGIFSTSIWKYQTSDDGENWNGTNLTGERYQRLRHPIVPVGGSSDFFIYQVGRYAHYHSGDFLTGLASYPAIRGGGIDAMFVVRVDLVASGPTEIWMNVGSGDRTDTSDPNGLKDSDCANLWIGDSTWQKLGATGLEGQAAGTMAFCFYYANAELDVPTFMSNWSSTADQGTILFRRKANPSTICQAYTKAGATPTQIGGDYADLGFAALDRYYGCVWRYDAGGLGVAVNGTISSTLLGAGTGVINAANITTLTPGITTHNSITTQHLCGNVYVVAAYTSAKPDAWVRTQTAAFADPLGWASAGEVIHSSGDQLSRRLLLLN